MNTLILNTIETTSIVEKPKTRMEKLEEALLSQTQAHSSRSEKYSVVSTGQIIQQFAEVGFEKVGTLKMERSTAKYFGFGTHLACLQNPSISFENEELDNELIPQLYIKNSYHGRKKWEMHFGLYRTFCLNGLILGNQFKLMKRKHIGLSKDEITQLVENMKDVMKNEVAPYILKLKARILTKEEQREFAKAVLDERYRNHEGYQGGDYEKLLEVNREADEGDSAWVVLQRVQENLGLNFGEEPIEMKCAFKAKDKEGNEVIKEKKLRKLKSIDEVTHLNQYVFDRISNYLVA
jgi:Domain of unknown function (DUF932)